MQSTPVPCAHHLRHILVVDLRAEHHVERGRLLALIQLILCLLRVHIGVEGCDGLVPLHLVHPKPVHLEFLFGLHLPTDPTSLGAFNLTPLHSRGRLTSLLLRRKALRPGTISTNSSPPFLS